MQTDRHDEAGIRSSQIFERSYGEEENYAGELHKTYSKFNLLKQKRIR
jgi:hypothetical protein